jgi:hypothetical protein
VSLLQIRLHEEIEALLEVGDADSQDLLEGIVEGVPLRHEL